MSFRVLTADLTETTQRDDLEDALNVAAAASRDNPNVVAVVEDTDSGEVQTVIHQNFAYLGSPDGQ